MKVSVLVSAVLITALSLAGCGGGGGTPSPTPSTITSITVSPTTALVAPDGTKEFTAADQDGTDVTSSVTWSATADCGTIALNAAETAAVYTAPTSVPSTNPLTVTATSGDVSGTASVGVFEITSLTDANSATVATTDTTGVYPTSFDIVFSVPMADTSVTTADNITLSCVTGANDPLTPAISVAATEGAENTYTVTVTDAYKYALMLCTLTITTNVTDANSNAIPAAATYAFTNACAVNDDFNADSQACWPSFMTGSDPATWAALASGDTTLTFNTAESTLDYSTTAACNFDVYKQVAVNSSGFQLTAHIKGVSGFDNVHDIFLAAITTGADVSNIPVSFGDFISAGIKGGDGNTIEYIIVYGNSGAYPQLTHTATGDDMYIRTTATDSGTTVEYSADGETWTSFSAADEGAVGDYTKITGYTSTFFGENDTYLSLWFYEFDAPSTTSAASVDVVLTSGVTSTSQY